MREAMFFANEPAVRADEPGDDGDSFTKDPPSPPPGAEIYYLDGGGQPCSYDQSFYWTWDGAPDLYCRLEHPAPRACGHGFAWIYNPDGRRGPRKQPQGQLGGLAREWYREMARQHHPDRGGSHQAMVAVQDGYELLCQMLKAG